MGNKVVVLHIVNKFISGGIRGMIMNYLKTIDKSKIQFAFLVQRNNLIPEDQEILNMGGLIYFAPEMRNNEKRYYFFLCDFLRKHSEITIVHSHLNLRNFIPLFAAKAAGVKIRISHSHKADLHESIIRKWRRKIISLLICKSANKFCACSKNAGIYLYGKSKINQVNIIKNAISLDTYKFSLKVRNHYRERFNFKNKLVVGHIGNFSIEKNHSFLIDIFYELNKIYENTVLVLVGDGELRANIGEKVSKLNLQEKVLFLGTCKDVHKLYQMFDCVVFPSKAEGFGMVILESEAIGLPTIVSSSIISEACINGLTKTISLEETPFFWAEEILGYIQDFNINDNNEIIRKKGFDIVENSKVLEKYYLGL